MSRLRMSGQQGITELDQGLGNGAQVRVAEHQGGPNVKVAFSVSYSKEASSPTRLLNFRMPGYLHLHCVSHLFSCSLSS
jgi:hypothetical protein